MVNEIPEEKFSEENLGLKVGTKELILWQKTKKICLTSIEACEDEMKIQKELLKIAEEKIKEQEALINK